MIQTVCGAVRKDDVSKVLAHEHLAFGKPGLLGDESGCYSRRVAHGNQRAMMSLVCENGVDLLVDATPIECGRDPLLMRRVSRESGCSIVCSTGFFKDEGDALSYLKSLSYICDLQAWIEETLKREILSGIGDTGIKAGAIKVASSLGEIKPLERMIMVAAARVQGATGVPILTHCDRGTMAWQQADLLEEQGATPGQVVLGHMTSNRDLEEIISVAHRGFLVGFDQFGIVSIPGIPSDREKMELLLAVLEAGCEDFVVLSHDVCFDRMGYVSTSAPRYPDMVFTQVLPYLREHGVGEGILQKLTRDNLLRAFGD